MYIGKTPTVGNFQVCDAISVVNGQAAYTLQVGGVNVAPESANHMLVSLNGILQKPGSSFTISGSTMTFASNLATGDVIDFVQILGNVLDIGQPSDDTVKTASLQANAVTGAKLNTDVISAQTALTSAPADTDELLISDAGTIKRIDVSLVGGKNTPAFIASGGSGNQTINHASGTTINYGQEILDTDSAFDISTDVFTVPSGKAGKYIFQASCQIEDTQADVQRFVLEIQKNDSSWRQIAFRLTSNQDLMQVSHTITAMDDASAADEYKAKVYVETADSGSVIIENGSTSYSNNWFQGFRLIT